MSVAEIIPGHPTSVLQLPGSPQKSHDVTVASAQSTSAAAQPQSHAVRVLEELVRVGGIRNLDLCAFRSMNLSGVAYGAHLFKAT